MEAIAFDLETRAFGAGNLAPRPIVISIATKDENRLSKDWRGEALLLLSRSDVVLIGHNIAYDLACIYEHAPELRSLIWKAYDEGRVSDTGIRDRIILLAKGHRTFDPTIKVKPIFSLAECVRRNLSDSASFGWWFDEKKSGTGGDASWRTRYQELENVDLSQWPEAASKYALYDSLLTLRVWFSQKRESSDYHDNEYSVRNEADQTRAAWALHLISSWGLITDPEFTDTCKKKWESLLDRLQGELIQTGLVRETYSKKNGVSRSKNMTAIRERVAKAYKARGMSVPETESGNVATDREVLEDTNDPTLLLLAEQTKIEKLISTYLPIMENGTKHPIHTRYEILLETGRTSSSDPNLQNIPRDSFMRDLQNDGKKIYLSAREAFVPRAGFVYVSVDYDTLELRTLAQIATWTTGGSELARVLNGGLDPHLDLAALMMGITYEEALRRKDTGDPEIKRNRTAAKPANFGYPGGLGADAFVDYARTYTGGELRLTTERAREMKAYWTKKWPEMQKYFKFVDRQQKNNGLYQVKMFDSNLVRSDCTYTAACNCYFQSLAAHGVKRALYAVLRACFNQPNSYLYNTHPVMFIHDEIIAEVPSNGYHEAGIELAEIMCSEMQKVVPDVRITASPAAMQRWYKSAEPVWDNGRLCLWKPKG